jgi:hypothetical protein
MLPYLVQVIDSKSTTPKMSIPCAESETALLVQKNLQSLFPGSKIEVKIKKQVEKNSVQKTLVQRQYMNNSQRIEKRVINEALLNQELPNTVTNLDSHRQTLKSVNSEKNQIEFELEKDLFEQEIRVIAA